MVNTRIIITYIHYINKHHQNRTRKMSRHLISHTGTGTGTFMFSRGDIVYVYMHTYMHVLIQLQELVY